MHRKPKLVSITRALAQMIGYFLHQIQWPIFFSHKFLYSFRIEYFTNYESHKLAWLIMVGCGRYKSDKCRSHATESYEYLTDQYNFCISDILECATINKLLWRTCRALLKIYNYPEHEKADPKKWTWNANMCAIIIDLRWREETHIFVFTMTCNTGTVIDVKVYPSANTTGNQSKWK